ncbi:Gfo/Idh/MocA family protein [Luteitalea sp.]|uniref:Gfo/Idh/MocA family protein n=1 Tax=Luteitalea sp. TaxID=2004800 RepID=UPI000A3EFBAB|nr:Gfo/Idh/MocA family oxidoreductase [Luteitalea sp.]
MHESQASTRPHAAAQPPVDRRTFVQSVTGSLAALSLSPLPAAAQQMSGAATVEAQVTQPKWEGPPRLKFGVIGLNHGHITGMTDAVMRGGGELAWVYAKEPALLEQFRQKYPAAKVARSEAEILDDASVKVVLSASIPAERAPLGIRVMRAGKDFIADKPGITSLAQLAEVRKVQAETRRIYSIVYSERFENRATVRAGELVKAGAIGTVLQTIGLGPHRPSYKTRPEWFFDVANYGGILTDIASHQADQFLFFTGSTKAEVVAAQAGNVHTPAYPKFQDFGDMMLRGNGGSGYVRVDWFTPDGLPTWGDGRLTILGTEGFIEIRKNVDIVGRPGGSHLFLSDQKTTRYIDTSKVELTYGRQVVSDILDRTETAMTQAHCFLAMQLVLEAQAKAQAPKLT